ncbi:hypothetical protein EON63_02265 [archaeon]|nr:MAG: hypothetical protein EON63_02265 [archaeon]
MQNANYGEWLVVACNMHWTTHAYTCTFMSYYNHLYIHIHTIHTGMPSPHGYRTALRLMKMAERFHLPVVTFVDTVGAWPTFDCERWVVNQFSYGCVWCTGVCM